LVCGHRRGGVRIADGGHAGPVVDIDVMLARRKMSIAEFAEEVGITPANVAVLKNGRKAVRFTTLDAVCRVLECQPGDVLRWVPEDEPEPQSERTSRP